METRADMGSLVYLVVLAIGMGAFGLHSLARAWRLFRASESAWYSIENRRMRSVSLARGLGSVALVVVGAGLLIWIALRLQSPTPAQQTPIATVTLLPSPLLPTSQQQDEVMPIASPAPSDVPELSPESGVSTLIPIPSVDLGIQAVVTNTGGGGLWLRDAPYGNGLVLLPEGSLISIRGGLVEVEGLMWQNVSDVDGREGWVAADYLLYR